MNNIEGLSLYLDDETSNAVEKTFTVETASGANFTLIYRRSASEEMRWTVSGVGGTEFYSDFLDAYNAMMLALTVSGGEARTRLKGADATGPGEEEVRLPGRAAIAGRSGTMAYVEGLSMHLDDEATNAVEKTFTVETASGANFTLIYRRSASEEMRWTVSGVGGTEFYSDFLDAYNAMMMTLTVGGARARAPFKRGGAMTDVHREVTAGIVEQLRRGVRPWTEPWNAGGAVARPLRHNGEPFSGINVLMLWWEAAERGYSAPTWMTDRQVKDLGGWIRPGQRPAKALYATMVERPERDQETGKERINQSPVYRAYNVFNVEQCGGLPETHYLVPGRELSTAARIAQAERFFGAIGADIRHGGNSAFYDASRDYINIPPLGAFPDPEDYYATLALEMTRWTGHRARLDRKFWRYGDAGGAMEGVVAELGAALVSADIGLGKPGAQQASRIDDWVEVLQQNPLAIFTAATRASEAARYLARIAESESISRREAFAREEVQTAEAGVAAAAARSGVWVIRIADGDYSADAEGRVVCFESCDVAETAAARIDPELRPAVKRMLIGSAQGLYSMPCSREIVTGDEICWTEQVWAGPWQSPELAGERTIEGRVDSAVIVGESSEDRLGLTVISADGVDAPEVGSLIGRTTGVLARRGVWRQRWADEVRRESRRAANELVRQGARQGPGDRTAIVGW